MTTCPTLISTQRYIDPAIVDAKRADKDYAVQVVEITLEGVDYLYVIDGHHSWHAAQEDGVDVDIEDHTHLYAKEIEHMGAMNWFVAHHGEDEAYDLVTGVGIW